MVLPMMRRTAGLPFFQLHVNPHSELRCLEQQLSVAQHARSCLSWKHAHMLKTVHHRVKHARSRWPQVVAVGATAFALVYLLWCADADGGACMTTIAPLAGVQRHGVQVIVGGTARMVLWCYANPRACCAQGHEAAQAAVAFPARHP